MIGTKRRNRATAGRLLAMMTMVAALLVAVMSPADAGLDDGDRDRGGHHPRPHPNDPVQLQILAINDFHGNIATSSGSFGGTGRADYLAANIAAAEAGVRNSIFVSAGDLIGASPLISALFHDEPTIEAMNLIGLDINAVGNHEFDEGPAELRLGLAGAVELGGVEVGDAALDGGLEDRSGLIDVERPVALMASAGHPVVHGAETELRHLQTTVLPELHRLQHDLPPRWPHPVGGL